MQRLIKRLFHYFKKIYNLYDEAQISFLAAQTSFFVILAFFPFVAFILTLIRETNLDDTIFMQALSSMLPTSTYILTIQVLDSARDNRNLFISIGGIITALWPFSKAVQSLIVSINRVHGDDRHNPLKRVGLSIVLTAAFILLIIVSTILLLFGRRLGEIFFEYLGSPESFLRIWDYLLLLFVFMILYKTIPVEKIRLSRVFPGAAFSTILWLLLSFIFSTVMNRFFKFSSIYGGIAGIILLIMWLYWAMHIILIGSVINVINMERLHINVKRIRK